MIERVCFGVFSPEEINRVSVVTVQEPLMYANSLPVNNGVVDFRLGSVDRRLLCGTCHRPVSTCPGHYGAIKLNFPVVHPGFSDVVLKLLKCCCFFCSSLLLSATEKIQIKKTRDRKQKLALACTQCRTKKLCPSCGGCVPTYSKVGTTLRCDFSKVKFADAEEAQYCQRPFTASEARIILQNLRNEDCELLGLTPGVSRPENFIMTSLVVPPPIIRPSVIISEGSRSRGQDDLTAKLCDIVKANLSAKNVLDQESLTIPQMGLSLTAQQSVLDLAFQVGSFINNDVRGQRQSVQRSGLPSKSLTSRLKGKEGRIRGTLMGKRVNFSARSVVSPDSEMDIDEVGIPYKVAAKLTIPERVTDFNIERLRARIRRGSSDLQGAQTVICNGEITLLEVADLDRVATNLRPGHVVERFLQNGDMVLFNRQPSLHRGSMLSYRVHLMPGSTFKLNLSLTAPLNGDFDGDELNVHVPQDLESQVEARCLMAVPLHIISAQSNKPCIGLVQDSLVAAWLLTDDDVSLDRRKMCELKALLQYPIKSLPDGQMTFTGKEAFAFLFPPDLEYRNGRSEVRIEKGRILDGRLCKHSLGNSSGSLVHHLWLIYGPEVTKRFLSDAQRLLTRWLTWRGFSIRLSDCEPTKELEALVADIVEVADRKAKSVEMLDPREEEAIAGIANRVLTDVGKAVHANLDVKTNALYQAVTSGSKGNLINITQLSGLVGQQSVSGRRVNAESTAHRFDARGSLDAKGFVRSSYFKGLTANEFFFHTVAGRDGLIDTAVKTASTGYLQRRIMKALETIVVAYDLSSRNSRQSILQFSYGGDDFDAMYLVRVPLDFMWRPWDDLRRRMQPEEERAFLDALISARRQRYMHRELESTAFVPCVVRSAIDIGRGVPGPRLEDASARAAKLDELVRDVCRTRFGRRSFFELHLRWTLLEAEVGSVSDKGYAAILAEVRRQSLRAVVAPGEPVGALAAQSIGEPATQMTLNTFHYAGVSSKNVTLGLPRIQELVCCTRNMKTPVMELAVVPSCSQAPALKKRLQESLVSLPLGACVMCLDILDEPDFFLSTYSPEDAFLAARERILVDEPEEYPPYVARLLLDPAPLVHRGLTPRDVAEKVERAARVHVVASEKSSGVWLLRIRPLGLVATRSDRDERVFLRTATEEIALKACREIILSGLPGITGAVAAKDKTFHVLGDDGELSSREVSIIETAGSNLRAAFALPEVLPELCTSNDVHDVLSTLGIEAAAGVLFDQMQHTLQFDGSYINERHLMLLVNLMSYLGHLLPVSRHGINRLQDSGPLARASFEEVSDQLLEAALYGDTDQACCISSRVMLGQRAFAGTGMCEVTLAAAEGSGDGNASKDRDSDDDVVFTTVDAEIEALNSTCSGMPVEMPFSESTLPAAVKHSFIQSLPAAPGLYAPSSPKSVAGCIKRRYAPSSPKLSAKRRGGSSSLDQDAADP